jgi:hypothetical protein
MKKIAHFDRDTMIDDALAMFAESGEVGRVNHNDIITLDMSDQLTRLADAILADNKSSLLELCKARDSFINAYNDIVKDKIIEMVDDIIFDINYGD